MTSLMKGPATSSFLKPSLGARAQSEVAASMAACHSRRRPVPMSRRTEPLRTSMGASPAPQTANRKTVSGQR